MRLPSLWSLWAVKSSAIKPRMTGAKLAWGSSKLPRLAVGIVLRELRISLGVRLIGVRVLLIGVRVLLIALWVLLIAIRRLVWALTLVISAIVWGIVPPIGIGIRRVQGADPFNRVE